MQPAWRTAVLGAVLLIGAATTAQAQEVLKIGGIGPREFFSVAMDDLDRDSNLVNEVLEFTCRSETDDIEIIRYDLPAGSTP